MPVRMVCPKCGGKVRIPDELVGSPVQCPRCKNVFTGGANDEDESQVPPPMDDDDQYEDEQAGGPSGSRRKGRRPLNVENWKAVRSGLARIIAAIFTAAGTFVLVLIILGIALFLFAIREYSTSLPISGSAWGLKILGYAAVLTLSIVGLKMCREAPEKHGCYKLATTTYHFTMATLWAFIFWIFLDTVGWLFGVNGIRGLGVLVAGVLGLDIFIFCLLCTGAVFFCVLFMRSVMIALQVPGLSLNCLLLAIATPFGMLAAFALMWSIWMYDDIMRIQVMTRIDPNGLSVMIFAATNGLVFMIIGIWYLVTLFLVRETITSYLERRL